MCIQEFLFLDLPFILNNDHGDINKVADNDTGKKVKKEREEESERSNIVPPYRSDVTTLMMVTYGENMAKRLPKTLSIQVICI
uniref:Uncharacterized protein n=1 Tax=Cucumis melo TaxID=3656 RepID=A0A9I9EKL9_CUCME